MRGLACLVVIAAAAQPASGSMSAPKTRLPRLKVPKCKPGDAGVVAHLMNDQSPTPEKPIVPAQVAVCYTQTAFRFRSNATDHNVCKSST